MDSQTAGSEALDGMTSALATPDQKELEALAIRLFDSEAVSAQRESSRRIFLADPAARTQDGLDTLDHALEELAYVQSMGAANGDPGRPKLMWYFTAPRRWLGHSVPGSRWGFDNPDNVYRFATVDGVSRYEIDVRPQEPGAVHFSYMLFDSFAGDNTKQRSIWLDQPIAALLDRHIVKRADGSFTITIDSDPANGRDNHIQSNADARIFMVRHTFTDWSRQHVPFVRIRRVGGPAIAAPASEQQLAERAAFLLKSGTDFVLRLNYNAFTVQPANVLAKPWIRGGGHGMSATGRFELEPGQALVVTLHPLGAQYLGFGIADPWTVTREHVRANGSLNNQQSVPNDDGSYTYVISATDPGVHNWLDTGGLHRGTMMLRWQALPPETRITEHAVREVRVVELDHLAAVLPADMVRVSPETRRQQYAERTRAYAHRYLPDEALA